MKKLTDELKPNKNVATESANVAHEFLACFQKMEFPDLQSDNLSHMCVDLGDIWTSQKKLAIQLQKLMDDVQSNSYHDLANGLVDLRASLEHIMWHSNRILDPMIKTAEFAFKQHESHQTKNSK
tara:strand:- start:286 stop:657 length:372 start_codon:yes stop_codon:yes gene_type:complete